jgi:tetratricopeptide (TPR) repeat protein
LYLKSQEMTTLADHGKNVAGMELLTKALTLDPRFAVAKSRLAYRNFFLSYRGDASAVDRAIALAREAADIDPTLAYPHFVLGSAYGVKGQDAQARLAFMRALELDPNHTVTMSSLSFHEYLCGSAGESLRGLTHVRERVGLSSTQTRGASLRPSSGLSSGRSSGVRWSNRRSLDTPEDGR